MNVGELIEKLRALPADAPLYVNSEEGGIDDLLRADHVFVKLNTGSEFNTGAHEAFDPSDSYEGPRYGPPDCEGYLIS